MNPVAQFLLVAAMAEESQPLLGLVDYVGTPKPGPTKVSSITEISFAGLTGRVLTTGIGPVNAAASLSAWFTRNGCQVPVLSIGSAGGLSELVQVGDVVLGDRYLYADVDVQAFGYDLGQVPQMPKMYPGMVPKNSRSHDYVHVGLIVTGSSFVTSELAATIRTNMPEAMAVDMESAALAQTCHLFGNHQFVSIRGISDLCSPRAGEDFHDGLGLAAARSAETALTILQHLVLM